MHICHFKFENQSRDGSDRGQSGRFSLFKWSQQTLRLSYQLDLEENLYFEHIVPSHREEVYGRWNGLPASREATSLTIIWRLPIVHDHIERPPVLYFYFYFCILYIYIYITNEWGVPLSNAVNIFLCILPNEQITCQCITCKVCMSFVLCQSRRLSNYSSDLKKIHDMPRIVRELNSWLGYRVKHMAMLNPTSSHHLKLSMLPSISYMPTFW